MLGSKFRTLSRELLIEINSYTLITNISSNCYQFLGYSEQEFIRKSMNEFLVENHQIQFGKEYNCELILKHKNGEFIYCDALINSDINENTIFSLININKYKELQIWENRFRRMLENTNDIVYLYDIVPDPKFIYINKAITTSLGLDPESPYSNPMYPFDIAHPDDLHLQYKKVDKETDFSAPIQVRMKNTNGEYVWFEDNVIPFYNDSGDLVSISGFCRNIQDRKELEQKLQELSNHDSLTGLFSNNYYTIEAKRLNEVHDYSIGIIMCDLDNLKTINDSMGHDYGDKLLMNFANLLKNEFGDKSILIRKGGDEFIILFENITEETTQLLYSHLFETLDYYNSNYPLMELKTSAGWAYSPTSIGQVESTFQIADKMMYEQKIRKKPSIQ